MEDTWRCVPLICEPLTTQPITCSKEGHQHLSELDLADFSYGDEDLEVDILIGSDQVKSFVDPMDLQP